MKSRHLVVGGILLLIVASAAFVLLRDTPAETPTNNAPTPDMVISTDPAATTDLQAAAPVGQQQAAKTSEYTDYTPEKFANAKNRRVLFFHASWCPQCRALDADIRANGAPANMSIFKVNFDTSHSLRKQYGVTRQTTFVEVDADGNLLKKFVAYDEPNLAAVKKALGQ